MWSALCKITTEGKTDTERCLSSSFVFQLALPQEWPKRSSPASQQTYLCRCLQRWRPGLDFVYGQGRQTCWNERLSNLWWDCFMPQEMVGLCFWGNALKGFLHLAPWVESVESIKQPAQVTEVCVMGGVGVMVNISRDKSSKGSDGVLGMSHI